jgi:NTE family protein
MASSGGQPSELAGNGQRRIGLVLPGGGARGAYEAGALSVLLPALEERGERVSIYCGTSVGAINGVALASHAHHGPTEQARRLLETWRSIDKHEVTGRLLGPDLAVGVGSYLGEALGVPGVRFRGLIQAKPLRENVERWIDWSSLHRNIDEGTVDSVCAVATSLKTGAPVGFTERHGRTPLKDGAEEIHYEPVELDGNHIRASAAIPAIFPPIEVPGDGPASGWFVDGATRLNTPIRPAIDLGAERVIVISFEPYALGAQGRIGSRKPGFADIAANVLDGLLTDQVVADIQRLVAINSFFAESAESTSKKARAYRESRQRRHYRKISYALVAPRTRRRLGRLAERIFERRLGGLGALRDIDVALMARALGGGPSRGELLTFLFFDPVFIEALIDAGRRDARFWLSRHPHLWCNDAAHDFDLNPGPPTAALEQSAIEEFRGLRRG